MCFFLLLTILLLSPPSLAQEDIDVNYPSKHPVGLLKGAPSPCEPHGRELKGKVISGDEPLEGASVYLASKGVRLRKAKAVSSDQGGQFLLCIRKKKKYRLTVLAPVHKRFTHVVNLDPKALPELTIELSPVKKGKPDGCERLGGEWLCTSHICPPYLETIRQPGSFGFEHCEACCVPRARQPCYAKRPCPCGCTFSGPFHKASKKTRKQSK